MAAGNGDKRSMLYRLRAARRAYDGPFEGAHVRTLVEEMGYEALNFGEPEALIIFQKPGHLPVPVDVDGRAMHYKDATFECLRRDLGLGGRELRRLLNQIRSR